MICFILCFSFSSLIRDESSCGSEEKEEGIRVKCMVDLLKDLQKDGLTGEFFIKLLKV